MQPPRNREQFVALNGVNGWVRGDRYGGSWKSVNTAEQNTFLEEGSSTYDGGKS